MLLPDMVTQSQRDEVIPVTTPPNTHSLILFHILTHHVQELNIRELSLVTEDSQYGVRLQGEPDNERLGKRLKGDFKKVCDWLSQLANVVEKIGGCYVCVTGGSCSEGPLQ